MRDPYNATKLKTILIDRGFVSVNYKHENAHTAVWLHESGIRIEYSIWTLGGDYFTFVKLWMGNEFEHHTYIGYRKIKNKIENFWRNNVREQNT